jgi:hypothetical protein
MLRWFKLFFIAIAILSIPVDALAQAEPTIGSLEVDLWPEYDNPGVLVIYRISLSPGVSLPAEMTLRIPAAAGEPFALAVRQLDGELVNLAYDHGQRGDWVVVQFTATMPEIQMEYYDPRLDKQDSSRSFLYTWPGDYAVEAFAIQVQQPFDANAMIISPSLGQGGRGSDGLAYYKADLGSLAAGQSFEIGFNYQKPTSTLSAETLEVHSSEPIRVDDMGRLELPGFLPWVLGIVLLGIVLVVGLWFGMPYIVSGGLYQSLFGRKTSAVDKRRRRRLPVNVTGGKTALEGAYCHQCGRRASPGDRFCRSCGTRLRTGGEDE